MITLAEVLVRPSREGNAALAARDEDIFLPSDYLATVPLSEAVARRTAEMHVTLNLRTPDAIQVVTALFGGATVFGTNDKRRRVPSPLTRVVLDDLRVSSEATNSPCEHQP